MQRIARTLPSRLPPSQRRAGRVWEARKQNQHAQADTISPAVSASGQGVISPTHPRASPQIRQEMPRETLPSLQAHIDLRCKPNLNCQQKQ